MSDPQPSPEQAVPETVRLLDDLREQVRPALVGTLLLTLITGVAFPVVLAVIVIPFFSHQSKGSLLAHQGVLVGSELIGQSFSRPEYFHPRPSAAGDGYDAKASGGTNLAPSNPKLRDGGSKSYAGVRELAAAYRRVNGLAADAVVPIDAATCSASGLDPNISPANAALQVPRVARQRRLSEDAVRYLVAQQTQGPQLGFLGEARVNVLLLNLALDEVSSRSANSDNRKIP